MRARNKEESEKEEEEEEETEGGTTRGRMDKGVRRRKGWRDEGKIENDTGDENGNRFGAERGLENELHSASLSRYRRFPRRKRSGRAVFSSPWEGEEKLYVLASAFELTRS